MEVGTAIWLRNKKFVFRDPILEEDSDDESNQTTLWLKSTIVKKTPSNKGFVVTISDPEDPRRELTYT